MSRILPVLGLLVFWTASIDAGADAGEASFSVTIENVSAKRGMMRLGLYTEETYYDDAARAVAEVDVRANPPTQTVEFTGVPPGVCAIQVFQDVNGDGKMDFSWVGLPVKPFGFSRDARAYVAKPDFARVKFALNAEMNAHLTIHLQNS